MPKIHWARCAALFWGLVVFMPVGVNYLAFFALLACMLAQGDWPERIQRLRGHRMWWPAVFFMAWTLLVLAVQPTYPETPSNLWHGLRIVATLALALALKRDEAMWALRGFWIAAIVSLAIVGLHHLVGLPDWPLWANLLRMSGNKSISNAVLFSLVAASALAVSLERGGWIRPACVALAVALMAVVTWALPSRTSLLIILITLAASFIHLWRSRKLQLATALMAAGLAASVAAMNIPAVQQRFAQGLGEIKQAQEGDVSPVSWGVRVNMYQHTAQMMLERPLLGWGVGSWNQQWKQRVPAQIADFNMPHNDFLWMGAQAGLPGALALLALVLAGMQRGWSRTDLRGRLAFAASLTLLLATSFNSAMRDAAIGLSVLWVVGLYLRMAEEQQPAMNRIDSDPSPQPTRHPDAADHQTSRHTGDHQQAA
ncbi:MAG: O-antigen ligase family protein [Burkholderiaceae bacterium]